MVYLRPLRLLIANEIFNIVLQQLKSASPCCTAKTQLLDCSKKTYWCTDIIYVYMHLLFRIPAHAYL